MASRSLTEIFVLLRNNAAQNRNIYSEQISDKVALVDHAAEDIEIGRVPPAWASRVEECQYIFVRLKQKLKELEELQFRLVTRPGLDDLSGQENEVQDVTKEIGQMFNSTYRLLETIRSEGCAWAGSSKRDRSFIDAICTGLNTTLQNLFLKLNKSQVDYFNKINSREERSKAAYFDIELAPPPDHGSEWGQVNSTEQLLILEKNMEQAQLREQETKTIVESILQLNAIFKDLSHMVIEQGTVLDRIDYNIECSQVQVQQGVRQLAKAATYQSKNKKMYCIVILASITTILIVILILTKS